MLHAAEDGGHAKHENTKGRVKLKAVTFMYVLSSGILLSAISRLFPMKTFPGHKDIVTVNEVRTGSAIYTNPALHYDH